MSILLNNQILKAAEQKLEASLTPENRQDYLRIVVAGMKLAMDKGKDGLLASLRQKPDPVGAAALGAVNLVMLMRHQSRGTMPIKALPPAAMGLLLQALDFLDKSRAVPIGANELARATHIFTNELFRKLRITPAMLQTMATRAHAVAQNPAHMDLIAQKAGVVKAPGAGMTGGKSAIG